MAINRTISDFNGDRQADILWERDGSISTWQATGTGRSLNFVQNLFYAEVDRRWAPGVTADFTGDGRGDILWGHDDGRLSIWSASAAGGFQQGSWNGFSPRGWEVAAAGDFNGDGKADLFWQRDDRSVSVWTANAAGNGFVENTYFRGPVERGWQVEAFGDFNGDGKDDLLWVRDGAVSVWSANAAGNGFVENSFYAAVARDWDVEAFADVNGDGRDDLIWQRDNGDVSVWLGSANGFVQNSYFARVDDDWSLELARDYTGDGRADLLFVNDETGALSVWGGTATGFDQNILYLSGPRSEWDVVL